jgi:hypothetical protein
MSAGRGRSQLGNASGSSIGLDGQRFQNASRQGSESPAGPPRRFEAPQPHSSGPAHSGMTGTDALMRHRREQVGARMAWVRKLRLFESEPPLPHTGRSGCEPCPATPSCQRFATARVTAATADAIEGRAGNPHGRGSTSKDGGARSRPVNGRSADPELGSDLRDAGDADRRRIAPHVRARPAPPRGGRLPLAPLSVRPSICSRSSSIVVIGPPA